MHITPGAMLTPLLTPKVPKTFQFHDHFLPVCVLSGRMRRAPVTILATRQKRIILRGAEAQLLNAPAPISGHDGNRQK